MKPFTRLRTARAAKAFKDFTGDKAKKIRMSHLDDGEQAGYRMGSVVGIAYEARRDGENAQYFHRFAKRSRPDLVARDDGKRLYIDGGSYKVTDRGIEDRMPALYVVNPSPRKGKRKGSAMARRRRRRSASGQFMRNPARRSYARRRRRTSARRQTVIVRANPVRRRRRRRSTALSRALPFRTNPVRRHRRRRYARRAIFRRNPIGRGALGIGQVLNLVVPGILTGGGAVAAEVGMAYMPIPASWKTGYMRHLVKGAISIAGGLVVADVLKMPKLGEYIALGGIAIASHDAMKDAIAAQMPGVGFGEYTRRLPSQFGYSSPAQVTGGFNEYVATPDPQFSY